MKRGCPNLDCKFYKKSDHVCGDGRYWRKNDSRVIKRFRCNYCKKRFSSATFSDAKGQKKRRVNEPLKALLSSSVSMRRAAKTLKIHRTTVKRKLIFLADQANKSLNKFLQDLQQNPVTHIQLDDLVTSEHTKLKPLTISIAIDVNSRKFLGAEVGQIPAFGHLAKKSVEKYGKRKNHHFKTMDRLFNKMIGSISPEAKVESDEHKLYPYILKKYLPNAHHLTYKGGRGCVVGQGELKKLYFDPLFNINHACAMLRANINRLVRRTWCTTKDPMILKYHLDIFMNYYNTQLV